MKGLTVILALLLFAFAYGLAVYLERKGALPMQHAMARRTQVSAFDSRLTFHR